MNDSIQQIADLEWLNYAAIVPIVQVTPSLSLDLRDDVIITSNEVFPYSDATHACLLRATPQTVDNLIAEVKDYFQSKGWPTTIFISPACTPADLPQRLLQKGFIKQEDEEAWMVFDNLLSFEIPPPTPKIPVRQIAKDELLAFVNIFAAAFEMPGDFVPYLAQMMEPSLHLPDIYHYLAFIGDQPVGTCSLVCYQSLGTLGGVGVMPTYRGSRAVTNLILTAALTAQRRGVNTILLQTTAGARLERLLRIQGFKRIFTRVAYTFYEYAR